MLRSELVTQTSDFLENKIIYSPHLFSPMYLDN